MVTIIPFYGDKGEYGCFSNFYKLNPYEYNLPACVHCENIPNKIICNYSEKAIMVCKASLMNDLNNFNNIVNSSNPKITKAYGRCVKNFDNEKWLSIVEFIAYDVLYQKFKSDDNISDILISTDNAILVEASPYDIIWGVGIGINNAKIYDMSKWHGKNILGYALMNVRKQLKNEQLKKMQSPTT
jgi:ribA/ribD-fused uncharacterized protein